MAFRFPSDVTPSDSFNLSRQSTGSSSRFESIYSEQQLPMSARPWSPTGAGMSVRTGRAESYDPRSGARDALGYQSPWNSDPWARRLSSSSWDLSSASTSRYATTHPQESRHNRMSSGTMTDVRSSWDYSQRRPSNRDEFDGPAQFLDKSPDTALEPRDDDMPALPISLRAHEQDEILSHVNDRLSKCAFDFVAKYQFPIPIEADKRPVRVANDREWQEWVYLLKRLATKRRIPARVLYNGQIKQFITILENSIEMRHAAKHQSRPLKDDRNILQLISSGLQVAKILKDAPAMQFLDGLYTQTEQVMQQRRAIMPSGALRAARA